VIFINEGQDAVRSRVQAVKAIAQSEVRTKRNTRLKECRKKQNSNSKQTMVLKPKMANLLRCGLNIDYIYGFYVERIECPNCLW
jgi:hypothetical protein